MELCDVLKRYYKVLEKDVKATMHSKLKINKFANSVNSTFLWKLDFVSFAFKLDRVYIDYETCFY